MDRVADLAIHVTKQQVMELNHPWFLSSWRSQGQRLPKEAEDAIASFIYQPWQDWQAAQSYWQRYS